MTNIAEKITELSTTISNFRDDHATRLGDLEKRFARMPDNDNFAGSSQKSAGQIVIENDAVKAMTAAFRGAATVQMERAALTTADITVGTGRSATTSLVPADRRPDIVTPPERRFSIRDLLPNTPTTSNSIEYTKETGYTNNAAPVAETTAKPYSNITFDLKTAPVRTLAHLFKASRQILDDAPVLKSYIDSRARYGLKLVEENQLLFGSGTGQNLSGIMPQATAYQTTRNSAGDNETDVLLHAISQSEEAELPATGIIISIRDWRRILGIKDGDGRYLSGGPFGTTAPRIWDLPVIPSLSMPVGQFLLGAFASGGAEIYDRMEIEVLLSSENSDDFEKNMFTIRAEERLALAVSRPEAFVTGTLAA